MTHNTTTIAGPYTAPTCKVINIELDGAILAASLNSMEDGGSYGSDGWNNIE